MPSQFFWSPGQPVLLLTAYAERLRNQPEVLAHVDLIIEKPLSVESIRRAINSFALTPKARPPLSKLSIAQGVPKAVNFQGGMVY